MKKIASLALAAAGIALLGLALAGAPSAPPETKADKYKIEEKDRIEQTLKFKDAAAPREVKLDNIFGAIEVRGTDGNDVSLSAAKTIRAVSADAVKKAKDEVKLDIRTEGGTIDIYVDGPFRCQTHDCPGYKDRDFGYEVHYDFVLSVPRKTALTLKTVNGGDVAVRGVEGRFDVSNVNGKVLLEDIDGSGEARTVNGRVRVGFARNPKANCIFKTINGDVELAFRDGFAADIKMKTFNGEAFTDFDVKSLPLPAAAPESKNGRFIYKRGGFSSVRIGAGGPEITCDTLNGDILIRKSH
jgi:DUF4097 and DUF4098 domain-containing protein YvlB